MKLKFILCLTMMLVVVGVQGQDLKIHVDNKGRVGFADSKGNVVIDCKYESAFPFSNGVAIVYKSKKYGMINTSGTEVLPLKYSSITTWNDLYLIKDGKKMGLANRSGNIILKADYSMISKSNCYGKAIIAIGGKATANEKKTYMAGAKYGIINKDGKILITPQYKGLYEFAYNGQESVYLHEGKRLLFSYHNTTDTLLTDCEYLGFSKNGWNIYEAGVIDGYGKVLAKEGLYSYVMLPKSGMIRYYNAKKKETICGFHNIAKGESLQVAVFNSPLADINYWTHGDFIGDIAPVNGTSWSFINKSGNTLRSGYTALKHSDMTGLWAAKNSSGKWDVFDDNNNNVEGLSGYNEIEFPGQKDDKHLFSVKKIDKYGAVSKSGEIVIPFEYELIMGNTYDVFAVKKNGKWGALTTDNKILFPTEYVNFVLPSERNSQHFWVQQSDSLYYHLNLTNGKISAIGFKGVYNFNEGIAFVIPEGFDVQKSILNRAQLYLPNTPYNQIYGTTAATNNSNTKKRGKLINTIAQQIKTVDPFKSVNFGLLMNTDDVLLINKPVSAFYVDAAKKEIKNLGNRALTDMEAKDVLLKITRENRVYGLNEMLDEDEWNY